jgi:hypothetical protein
VLAPDGDPDGYLDAVALDRLASERIAAAAEVQRQVAALVGRAESPDRRVRAGYSAARGLCELHLDPRALRLPAADLAATILQVADAARADLAGQVDQAVREEYGDAFDPNAVLDDPDRSLPGPSRPPDAEPAAASDPGRPWGGY